MATGTTQTGSNGPPAKNKKELIPPEPKFWQRYSPHHEAPLSSASSFFLHIAALAMMVLIFWLGNRLAETNKSIPVDAVAIGGEAGGGGSLNGQADGGQVTPRENVPEETQASPKTPPPTVIAKETLQAVNNDPLDAPEFKDPAGRLVPDASEAVKSLEKLDKNLREKLFKGLGDKANVPTKGGGGSGMGGGKDKGVGPGEGPGMGAGTLDARTKRTLRWTLMFNTLDGNDYRRQLAALGAILAVPDRGGEYRVIRDLTKRPATGEIEDVGKINRIFWVDDKPDSVRSLAVSLGLNPLPSQIVAFFPVELEREMLRLELNFRHKREDQIRETRFHVRNERGRYVPFVVDQR